jgi:hypothetical protein
LVDSIGRIQQDLTAFGTEPFSGRLGTFFEVPVARHRDLSNMPGIPSSTDVIGARDIDLKFLWNPEALGLDKAKMGARAAAYC